MSELPSDWVALAGLVFLLGLKHGFDADHLATIDGLTRFNARSSRPFARYCGALFSLGHGVVVLGIALFVGIASERWSTPAWLETAGIWISIFFLTALGVLNLRAVLVAEPHEVVSMIGLKGRWLGRLNQAANPWTVAGVGALFALSFDTISQAALFAVTATQFGGVGYSLALGLLFMLGMLVTDGINGLWISRLIARSDEIARVASRVMGLAVACVSLLVAALGAARVLVPAVDQFGAGKELLFGGVVIAFVLGGFLLGALMARTPRVTA